MLPQQEEIVLTTARLKVSVGRKDGAIVFSDAAGKKLFGDDGRRLTPATVNGEKTYHAEMFSRLWGSYEAFYGLGQHQSGVWNYRGESVDLLQGNNNIVFHFSFPAMVTVFSGTTPREAVSIIAPAEWAEYEVTSAI